MNIYINNKAFILHINIERASTITIILITLALFIAVVFLVFVKVIFLTIRTNTTNNTLKQLESIKTLLLNKKNIN